MEVSSPLATNGLRTNYEQTTNDERTNGRGIRLFHDRNMSPFDMPLFQTDPAQNVFVQLI